MKIYNKIRNNVEYAKWAKLRNQALKNMNESTDEIDFNYWAKQYKIALEKCMEIEI